MLDNTTVTLPLNDFDTLRAGERAHRDIASALARCFDYTCTKNPISEKCNKCKKDSCEGCKTYKENPPYNEFLTVDIERLIGVTKEYALYGKDVETDLDAIPIEHKAERVKT